MASKTKTKKEKKKKEKKKEEETKKLTNTVQGFIILNIS